MFKKSYPPNGVFGRVKVGAWGMEFPIRLADEGTCISAARQVRLPVHTARRSKALSQSSRNPKLLARRKSRRSGRFWSAGGAAALSIPGQRPWTHCTRFCSVLKTQTNDSSIWKQSIERSSKTRRWESFRLIVKDGP